ncbi:MAG: UDP-N-acetylglucosamine 1-carboxyvinyltransferase, partial [Bacteriovoracaceae bacterium]|nr:UDP-N-acetylglucosamine 1-carboxyvinyltransferase [Bacteriovoracaceae bacterium]
GPRLEGSVEIPPAKNAALPLLCLPLLTDEPVIFDRVPDVADIISMENLLKSLGVDRIDNRAFQCKSIRSVNAPYEWVRKMRASVLVLGPLLARAGEAHVSMPGGCAIGERPVDIHLKGLQALGAEIELEGGYIKAKCKKLKGCRFVLDFPTVTGTINLLMAAVLAEGETVLENVAREPEVHEVCEALIKMGAEISGVGTDRLQIQGKEKLRGLKWSIQPDRIQLITYLAAGAITGGKVECYPYRKDTMNVALQKFSEMGCEITESDSSVTLKAPKVLMPIEIETGPFPAFPTDAQAQFTACLSVADRAAGASIVRELVFENRFQHVSELRRMGADIEVKGNTAIIKGVQNLSGAAVMASDLRASATLVLAGLKAEQKTQVLRVYHLDRGYEKLEERLRALGAKIWRDKQ